MKTQKYVFDTYVDGMFEQYGPYNTMQDLHKGLLEFYKVFCVSQKGLEELSFAQLVELVESFLDEAVNVFSIYE